jgi:hypothetical protein
MVDWSTTPHVVLQDGPLLLDGDAEWDYKIGLMGGIIKLY